MPYTIRHLPVKGRPGEPWAKVDRHGHVVSRHRTRRKAKAAIRAYYASRTDNALALLVNANPLRIDPTRTTLIRRQFEADILRRFRKLRNAVWDFIFVKDALALKEKTTRMVLMAVEREFEFRSDAGKLEAFNDWLRRQAQGDVLSGGEPGKPWTEKYIESAFKRGQSNAWSASKRAQFMESLGVGEQTAEQFLRSAFNQPEALSKVRLLATRAFEDLKGVTASMSAQMNRILSQGMIDGRGPEAIANEMFDKIKSLGENRALTIARTEIVRAHAEGQLDAFEELGVDELGVKAEWSTAGDDRVCPECEAMEGKTFTMDEARGLIPLHPQCRCSFIPALPKTESGKRNKKKR